MGYYTNYTLDVIDVPGLDAANAIIAWLVEKGIIDYALSLGPTICEQCNKDGCYVMHFDASREARWYDHGEDIQNLSAAFPLARFKLHGEGDDRFDIWDKYFANGQFETCPYKLVPPKPLRIRWDEKALLESF